jgi:glycosyltransferase involved in cell wall biosynthesis
MRYIWDSFDTYFNRPQTPGVLRSGARLARPYLRKWDVGSSSRVDTFLCNSRHIRQKIRKFYDREAGVVYPPVDLSRFRPGQPKEDYYLMVGAIVPNKRVDLAVETFNRLGLRLKIAGCGWDESYCRRIAGPNVEFLGYVDDALLVDLYQRARAFVFPGVDDFGITPLEAQACGTPVVAFARGGALETVTECSGIFFGEPTVDGLAEAILKMERLWKGFSAADLVQNAAKFGRGRFKEQVRQAVEDAYYRNAIPSPR